MATGMSMKNWIDLMKADWSVDWDHATATTWKVALFGAKTIDYSGTSTLAYGTSPFATGEQAASGAYATGGLSIPGRTVTDITGGIMAINCTYMEWNPITTSAVRNALFYKTTDNKVLINFDLGTPSDVTAGVFRITMVSDRLITQKVY